MLMGCDKGGSGMLQALPMATKGRGGAEASKGGAGEPLAQQE